MLMHNDTMHVDRRSKFILFLNYSCLDKDTDLLGSLLAVRLDFDKAYIEMLNSNLILR